MANPSESAPSEAPRASLSLRELDVFVLDCQASGATPAHGDLLELGWAVCAQAGIRGDVHGHWIVPRTARRVPGPIRELTGWSEACVADALAEDVAYRALRADLARLARVGLPARAPAVIHYARFELGFLRDLHQRLDGDGEFPLDAVCVHAIAARLFPDLPRRNIRALAGFLGHSAGLLRRSAGHVEATAFIWRALVPLLEQLGVSDWEALKAWLAVAPPRAANSGRGGAGRRRSYPLAPERRRALPDTPGVYRFLRKNLDLLYVGKAKSLKKRVASHFASRGRPTERGLELLTQVHTIDYTETPSILEAALLESDEIKRLDPPYNVQLRSGERQAWFASRDLWHSAPVADAVHRIGPLPSQRALTSLAALIRLAEGAEPTPQLRAIALAVPVAFLPDDALFAEGWQLFAAEHLSGLAAESRVDRLPALAARRVDRASRALWASRGRSEPDSPAEERPPDQWDLARVRRRLERALVQSGLLMRRARWLRLLAESDIAYREAGMPRARALQLRGGELVEKCDLDTVAACAQLAPQAPRSRRELQFDAAAYDRLRVLATELRRVHDEAGELAIRFGRHVYTGDRLLRLMAAV